MYSESLARSQVLAFFVVGRLVAMPDIADVLWERNGGLCHNNYHFEYDAECCTNIADSSVER